MLKTSPILLSLVIVITSSFISPTDIEVLKTGDSVGSGAPILTLEVEESASEEGARTATGSETGEEADADADAGTGTGSGADPEAGTDAKGAAAARPGTVERNLFSFCRRPEGMGPGRPLNELGARCLK